MLDSRDDRNRLRGIVMKAEEDTIITKEEAGFAIMLAERFRADIDKKIKQVTIIQGEINQLRMNEQIIIDLISNMISAAERNKAREETINRIRGIDEESETE